jgi:tyrosyl-tRNA synthetase
LLVRHAKYSKIGGATGSVGDPSGRSSERTALAPDALARNIASIEAQIKRLFKRGISFAAGRMGTAAREGTIEFKDNAEWTAKMSLLEFLSGPGKRARVGVMLARDSYANHRSTSIHS